MSDDSSTLYKIREEATKPDVVYAQGVPPETPILRVDDNSCVSRRLVYGPSPISFTLTTIVMACFTERAYISSTNVVT